MRRSVLPTLVFLIIVTPTVVRAAAEGTDLIFVIDQSGSMMRQGRSPVANDPYGKRFEALRSLEGRLVESAVRGMTNRISVIEFGGRNAQNPQHRPLVMLSRREIAPLLPGSDPQRLRQIVRDLFAGLKPEFRGDTDHAAALRLAVQEVQHFLANPPAVHPGGKTGARTQTVVLITDGASYADRVPREQQRSEIKGYVEFLTKQSPPVTFAVFGFQDHSDPNWWKESGAFWRALASKDKTSMGHAFLLTDYKDVVKEIVALLHELIPPVGIGVGGQERYVAPAYLKALEFTVDFQAPSVPLAEINIQDPAKNRVPVTVVNPLRASATVPYPQPGEWQLRQPHSPYTVNVTPHYETATLVEPAGPVPQHTSVTIRYRLDGNGPGGVFVPQPALPPLQFELTLRSPLGAVQALPIQIDTGGHVSSTKPVPLTELGDYKVQFKGTTTAADGTEHTVYQSAQASGDLLLVNAAIPVQLRLLKPARDTVILLRNGRVELPIMFDFYSPRSGTTLKPQEVVRPGVELQVSYLSEQGQEPPGVRSIPLHATEQGLEAQLLVDFGGTRWDYLNAPGHIRLLIKAPQNSWQDNVYYLQVADGGHWTSAPLTIRESWVNLLIYLLLWRVVPIGALLGGLLLAWLRFGLPWLIARSDRKYKRSPQLIFKAMNNPDTVPWNLKGIRRLRPTRRVVNLSEGEVWNMEGFEVTRHYRQGRWVTLTLSYKPKLGKGKVKDTLQAKDDNDMSSARHEVQGLGSDKETFFILRVNQQ